MMQATARVSSVLGLLGLLLWADNAQAVPCQNNLPPSNPDAVYIDHSDGTVTDTRTGLMWKQCAEGRDGATCQPPTIFGVNVHWANALARAEASTFANYTDWRLPNVKELSSLVEECRVNPSINTNLFPNTPTGISDFWSGSPSGNPLSAYSVSFGNGQTLSRYRSNNFSVRLVRGGQ